MFMNEKTEQQYQIEKQNNKTNKLASECIDICAWLEDEIYSTLSTAHKNGAYIVKMDKTQKAELLSKAARLFSDIERIPESEE